MLPKDARIALALVLCFLSTHALYAAADEIPLTSPESVGMSSERLERIVPGLQQLIDEQKIPGTVTLVARQGKVVHFEAAGSRHVAAGKPMEKDTIFRLYSQSKPITGVATMILFEQGHFLLSDPVSKYLPEFSELRVYEGEKNGEVITEPARPMTIHHLLTHTSGLTYDFFPTPVGRMYQKNGVVGAANGVVGIAAPAKLANLEEWAQVLTRQPLVAQPVTQ